MKKQVLVTTTIRVPKFLEGVLENAVSNKRSDINCIVIGDVKTPPATRQFCESLQDKFGIEVKYLDLEDQEHEFADQPELLKFIPKNWSSRILLGNLLAYREGCESLIMILDDDFVKSGDFFGGHSAVGKERELTALATDTGWFNPYSLVKEAHGMPFYFRGFPWSERRVETPKETVRTLRARVVFNQGLIMGNPDVDAIARLFWPVEAISMDMRLGASVGLQPGIWSPCDMENIALARDIIPIYFLGRSIGRNCDIWASFIVQRLAEHMGDIITVGYPLVEQERNPHNLWDDLESELAGNRATDRFVAMLRSIPLTKDTYLDSLEELIEGSLEHLSTHPDWPEQERNTVKQFFMEYQTWQRFMREYHKE